MVKKLILSLGALAISIVFIFCTCFSWFVDNNTKKTTIDGSTPTAYYKSGDGSKDNPYVIAKPIHLYNFAWLQYMGTYNKTDSDGNLIQTYFKIESDDTDDNGNSILDMSNSKYSILPPIGTESNPFVGNFDGNNTIITGLTTASNGFSTMPASVKSYSEPHILGFFGYVGETSSEITGYDTSINTISNLYIDDYAVKNTSNSVNVLVGLLAGYANAQINNSGVLTAQFDLVSGTTKYSNYEKISKYALVGDYNKDNFNWNPTSESGGSGTDYGTSTDLRDLYVKLQSTDIKETIGKTTAVPFHFDSSSTLIKGAGSKSITSSGKGLTVSYASSLSVSSTGTNIGYYSGGEVKLHEDYFNTSSTSRVVNFDNMKTAGNSQILVDDDTDHINKIKAYLKEKVSDTHYRGDTAMVLSGTYFGDGATKTAFPSSNDNYLFVKDAKVGNWSGDLFIPARGIWVAPTKPGRFEFVAINPKDDGTLTNASISIIRLKRSKAKDYSTGFSNTTYMQQNDFTNDMAGCIIYGGTNAYVPYYYGVDVSQEDIDNGYEFFITKYNSTVSTAIPYIVYIDIGTTGESTTPDPDTNDSEIDFVYFKKDSSSGEQKDILEPIKTKNTDGTYSTNDNYKYSDAYFSVDGTSTAAFKVQFKRTLDSGATETITLYYYFTPSVAITVTPNKSDVATSSSTELIGGN